MKTKRILVVGNYSLDEQQSMIKFAELLVRIYNSHASVRLVLPPALIARLPFLTPLTSKYLAYIDKLFIFPFWLFLRSHSFDLVHIADHSNAFYTFCCPYRRCIVTCHDMLAVRAAFGDSSAACTTSPLGIWLQRLISAGLRRASAVAFDSYTTFVDFKRIIGLPPGQRHGVIPIPLNAPFTPEFSSFELSDAEKHMLPPPPYLLMVGSSLARKNRNLAFQLLVLLADASPYSLVIAGAPLTLEEQAFQTTHPLGPRVFSIPGPSHSLLNRLYCQAHALLFPSFSEGFGWPLIEAQICRCPVIASLTTSIPEVAGDGALYSDPTDVATFAAHVLALEDSTERARLINLGLINTRRFDSKEVADAYRRFALQL